MGCLDTSVLVVPGHVLDAQRHFYGHIQGLLPVHGLSGILLHVEQVELVFAYMRVAKLSYKMTSSPAPSNTNP